MMEKQLVPVYMPGWMWVGLRRVKRMVIPPKRKESVNDLSGSRDIEWSYIASRLPMGPGRVFDFGCGAGTMCIHAIQKGYEVVALDLSPEPFPWSHPKVKVVRGDLLKVDLGVEAFDFVLNCSTVEHVGLSGRYGVTVDETNGDLEAMQRLHRLLKPGGKMLLTIPCGRDATVVPWHRVYGSERLPMLLDNYVVDDEAYWAKQLDNVWYPADRRTALAYTPTNHPTNGYLTCYALGCFVLQKG